MRANRPHLTNTHLMIDFEPSFNLNGEERVPQIILFIVLKLMDYFLMNSKYTVNSTLTGLP